MLTLLGIENWIADNMFKRFMESVRQRGKSEKAAEDFVEVVAGKVEDMKDGQMETVDLGEGKALLVRDHGEYFAVGAKCSHFGAALSKGAYCNGRVRCPWHGACFNVKTGDIEDFPGLDSIPKHEVIVANGEVIIRAEKKSLENFRRVKSMTKKGRDSKVFVVVGGGAAGASCVETLRQEGFSGRLVLVNQEDHLPYDRTLLSKMLDAKPEKLALRNVNHYEDKDVEFMGGKEVVKLDPKAKLLHFSKGVSLRYDKVVFATGGSPKSLGLPGSDLKNVCLLRRIEDGNFIAGLGKEKNVVIIGTSFIGLEVAAYMLDKAGAASVTVVGRSEIPLRQVLGANIGIVVKKLLENKGAKFVFKNPPKEFVGEDGRLTAVVLEDGTRLEADVCVIGAGVDPSTKFLADTGMQLSKEGYITVDKQMRTSLPDVFAAGDITKFPLFISDDESVNIQHWQMAIQQGRISALNMLDKDQDIKSVPFFWTMILGKGIRYAGYGAGHDDVVVQGSLDDLKFIAYYTKGDKVVAVATMTFDPVAAQAAEIFYNKIPLTKQEIQNDTSDPPLWTTKLAKYSTCTQSEQTSDLQQTTKLA